MMRRYKLEAKDFLDTSIFATAFVSDPAIRVGFVYLNGDSVPSFNMKFAEEKGMVYTPVLIPNQIIPRVDEQGEEFEVYFDAKTIEELREAYIKAGNPITNWNSQHTAEKLEGVTVLDNWIIDNPEMDRAIELGFVGLPKGTWMQGIKVDNPVVRERIKNKEYFGISIEGDFNHVLTNLSNINNKPNNNLMNKLEQAITKLTEKLSPSVKLGSDILQDDSVIYFEGEELLVGAAVFTDVEMTTRAGQGEYNLKSGRDR